MLNHVKGTNLDLDIPKSMYNIYFIYWRIIIYMTSFNFVQKYEIQIFHFIDTLNEHNIYSCVFPNMAASIKREKT